MIKDFCWCSLNENCSIFFVVYDINLSSMQLDQDIQLGISIKNITQHMYTMNLYWAIDYFFLFFVIALLLPWQWMFVFQNGTIVLLLLACHPTSITSKTEHQIFTSKHQSKYCLINMGGNWSAKKLYRKDIQQKQFLYANNLTGFYTLYDHSKTVCLRRNFPNITFPGKSEEYF